MQYSKLFLMVALFANFNAMHASQPTQVSHKILTKIEEHDNLVRNCHAKNGRTLATIIGTTIAMNIAVPVAYKLGNPNASFDEVGSVVAQTLLVSAILIRLTGAYLMKTPLNESKNIEFTKYLETEALSLKISQDRIAQIKADAYAPDSDDDDDYDDSYHAYKHIFILKKEIRNTIASQEIDKNK